MSINLKQAATSGVIAGSIFGGLVFAFCCLGAYLHIIEPQIRPYMFVMFYPWYCWGNIKMALAVFAVMGLIFAIPVAFRPDLKRKKLAEDRWDLLVKREKEAHRAEKTE